MSKKLNFERSNDQLSLTLVGVHTVGVYSKQYGKSHDGIVFRYQPTHEYLYKMLCVYLCFHMLVLHIDTIG